MIIITDYKISSVIKSNVY